MKTRSNCLELDAYDPLARLRSQFDLPEGLIYLDGNSLGARPKAALTRAAQVVADEWGHQLIRSWNTAGWFDLPRRLGDKLAPLIGAHSGEVAVTDSTSVNIFKALAATLDIQAHGVTSARRIIGTERDKFPTDIFMASGLAHWLGRGYTVRLVDSAAELPAAIDADGAVVMLTHVNYRTAYQHDMSKSLALTDLFIELVEARCGRHSLELATPRKHAQRGSHASFRHAHGYALMQALIARGVIGDYREPGIMRFGFTPLYTSFADVWDAVEFMRRILDDQAYDLAASVGAVT